MSRGRKLAATGKLAEAERAFDEAVRARPFDAAARGERAFVRYRAISDEEPKQAREARLARVLDQLSTARALADEPEVRAQIEFNEGLVYERLGNADQARIAFVEAERSGSSAAGRRIGSASRCTVAPGSKADDLKLVPSWTAALAELRGPGCDPPDTRNDAEARAFACGGCANFEEGWKKGKCEGSGPWSMRTGYMHCQIWEGAVVDFGQAGLYAESGSGLGDAYERVGALWSRVRLDRGWAQITGDFSDSDADADYRLGEGWIERAAADDAPRCRADEGGGETHVGVYGCGNQAIAVEGSGSRTYYDAIGRWVATLEFYDLRGGPIDVRAEPDKLVVKGAGCDFVVPFGTRDR